MSFASLFPETASAGKTNTGSTPVGSSGWSSLFAGPTSKTATVAPTANPKADKIAANAASARENLVQNTGVAGYLRNFITGLPLASGIPQAFSAGIDQANRGSQEASTAGGNLVNRGEGVLNFASGLTGAAFAPLAPITDQIGHLINAAGTQVAKIPAISEYGKAVTNLPNQDQGGTTDRILSALSNLGNLAMLGVGGGKVKLALPRDLPVKFEESTGAPNISRVTKLPVSGESVETKIPFANDFRQGPDIQMGAKPREALPTIQTEAKAPELGKIPGMKYEEVMGPNRAAEAPTRPVAASSVTETPSAVSEAPVKATGPMVNVRPSESAHSINEAIVERGADASLLKDMTPTEVTSYKADRVASLDLLDTNMKLAESAAKGEVSSQSFGVKNPVILFNEVLKRAQKENNIPLMRELQKSPYAGVSSESGKGLGAHGFSKPDHSTIDLAREVEKVRASVIEKKGENAKSFVSRAKRQVARATTKDMVRDFINTIPDC